MRLLSGTDRLLPRWSVRVKLDWAGDVSADLDTATRYRERAVRLRNIASDKTALAIRDQLLQIAGDYERLAAMLDDVDATNAAMAKRLH